MRKMDIVIITVFSMWLSTGCAGKKIANTGILDQEAKTMATNSTLSPDEAILEAAGMLNKANTENLSFFAPLHLTEARSVLNKAQKLAKSGAKPGLVLEKAFKVKTLINDGLKTKEMVKTTLSKVLDHKQVLDDLDVQGEFPEKYEKSVSKIRELVLEVEAGNFSAAVDGQSKVLVYMSEVEIAIMKKRYLSSAQAMMEKAKDIDADDYAEVTYKGAQKQYETSSHFIERNYRDRKGVKQAGEEALLAAKHAFFVAKEAKRLVKIGEEEAEQRVLYFESLLDRIGQASGNQNIIGLSLYDQAEALAKHIQATPKDSVIASVPPALKNDAKSVSQPKADPKVSGNALLQEEKMLENAPSQEKSDEINVAEDIGEVKDKQKVDETVEGVEKEEISQSNGVSEKAAREISGEGEAPKKIALSESAVTEISNK